MGNESIFPYRLRFAKEGRQRFLSHHELMRLFERAVRRAGIPIRISEGFHPHPQISFPTALGMGIESVDEVVELELSRWVSPGELGRLLGEQFPRGLSISSVLPFRRRDRSCVDFVEFEADVTGQLEGIDDRIGEFLELDSLVMTRHLGNRTKEVDVRPYVMAIEAEPSLDRIYIRIQVTDRGSARPEEVLRAIGVEMREDVRIRKTHTELIAR